VRESVKITQKLISRNGPESVLQTGCFADCAPPNNEIYEFKGTYFGSETNFEPLKLKNTMWAHTTVASGDSIGLVIYVGKETRMEMNSRKPITKFGKTDQEINTLSKFLFVFVVILSGTLLILSGINFSGG
jgi:phospholipid-translocating ATPase